MTSGETEIEIPLSKIKITLLFLAAVGFVVLGAFFIRQPETFISVRHRSEFFILIMGFVAILFFGICALFIGKKLFDNKPGLIINENGIIDNSNATNVGLIEWEDIKGFQTMEIASTKMILLKVHHPQKYIEREKNRFVKKTMKANFRIYGSPLSINVNSLKIKFADLEKLVIEEFRRNRQKEG